MTRWNIQKKDGKERRKERKQASKQGRKAIKCFDYYMYLLGLYYPVDLHHILL